MRSHIRCLLLATLLTAFTASPSFGQILIGAPTGATRAGQNQFRGSGRIASLKDQLNSTLKTRRNVEKQFIDKVVQLVRTGKLPVKLVVETMQYARQKPTKHPFQYFQRALALRAARLNVVIKTV